MKTPDLATLCGYASALPTPFKGEHIDGDAFGSFCQWQIEQGSSALVVNGTTGEAPTLTREEQNRLVSMAVEVAQGQVPVIAGAGSNSTSHAIVIARDAQRTGAIAKPTLEEKRCAAKGPSAAKASICSQSFRLRPPWSPTFDDRNTTAFNAWDRDMHGQRRHRHFDLPMHEIPIENIAAVYNRAGDDYVAYADGDPKRLFSFEGLHAYADRRLWSLLESKLSDLRASGARSISVLDAGCGPGTWLRRLVTHARLLGFSRINARGFDVAQAQIQTARRMARDLAGLPGVKLTFDVADLTGRLPEADASIDMTLCLYSVLCHLPVASLPKVSAEIARVTRGHFITTVRSIGSAPTIFVDTIDKALHFKLDHNLDRCEVELCGGRRIALDLHLFTACELRNCFAHHFDIEDLCGLDIFHSRFVPDRRWNPASFPVDRQLSGHLAQLDEAYARNPCFMEHAAHLLLVGCRGRASEPKHGYVQSPELATTAPGICLTTARRARRPAPPG